MRFNLYPIYSIARPGDEEPFDTRVLPLEVCEGVAIEAVAKRFRDGAFALWKPTVGEHAYERITRIQHALVHRYEPQPMVQDGVIVGEQVEDKKSEETLRNIAACLRLIRPMRQFAGIIRGTVRQEDEGFDVSGFEVPSLGPLDVPSVQKLFHLRNRDAESLRFYAPLFLQAMRPDSQFWKFRMALQFHELGYFQSGNGWKARYLLWCSAIEAIFTSHNREHQGTLVATSRIKWFLGENTSIYAPGDLRWRPDPGIRVGDIVSDLYAVRNLIAHGDKIPDEYLTQIARQGVNGGVPRIEVLTEAASFVIRTSLLKILQEQLLAHFTGADSGDAYFGAHGLTNRELRAAQAANGP